MANRQRRNGQHAEIPNQGVTPINPVQEELKKIAGESTAPIPDQTAKVVKRAATLAKNAPKAGSPCACGCGDKPKNPRSRFMPGHDSRLRSSERPPAIRIACLCGCGGFPAGLRSSWLPGHDAKHMSKLLKAMREGHQLPKKNLTAQIDHLVPQDREEAIA